MAASPFELSAHRMRRQVTLFHALDEAVGQVQRKVCPAIRDALTLLHFRIGDRAVESLNDVIPPESGTGENLIGEVVNDLAIQVDVNFTCKGQEQTLSFSKAF